MHETRRLSRGQAFAVTAQRRMRLWSRVVEAADGGGVTVAHVCTALVEAAGVDGAWVTVLLPANLHETVYASDAVAERLADLALTLGEGPGSDASAGTPALAADLLDAYSLANWPVFAPAVAQAGAKALFALPLQIGSIQVGVINLYRASPGSLDRDQLADALLLADTACALLLDARGADLGSASRPHLEAHHPEVHQATGMLIVQLRVSASVALIRLRAYAYAHDLPLRDVAREVVARRLRFSPDADIGDGGPW